jgi:hypothetical protein
MKNMSVFDSGLKIAETPEGFEIGSSDNVWVHIPSSAVRNLFDLKTITNNVMVVNRWVDEATDHSVEAVRYPEVIRVTVNRCIHHIRGKEMQDLRRLVLGSYTYNQAFEPPAEVVAAPELETADVK